MVSAKMFENQVILAPLTRGGNLPFRRLCASFGADVTVSEMAYARELVRGEGREFALLRRHPSEKIFGVQLAARQIPEARKAVQIVQERGADFIDLNCGCPTHDVVRRGLGANMLRNLGQLEELVTALVQESRIPVSVKVRLGWDEEHINVIELAMRLANCGIAALSVHGRTRNQRYSRSADWMKIGEVRELVAIPVVGNGDILTAYEAAWRKTVSGCSSIMVARGALIKPWIFEEIKNDRDWQPTTLERIAVYYQLAAYMREHFYDDERGKKRAMYFLPWHFSFFHRYRPLPRDLWEDRAKVQPLLQTRMPALESPDPLSQLFASPSEELHLQIAHALWDSKCEADGVVALNRIAATMSEEIPAGENPNDQPESDDQAEFQG